MYIQWIARIESHKIITSSKVKYKQGIVTIMWIQMPWV